MPHAKEKPVKVKRPKIHIGSSGGVRVNADEFFAQPEVQRKREVMRKLNIAGTRLNGNKLERKNTNPEKASTSS